MIFSCFEKKRKRRRKKPFQFHISWRLETWLWYHKLFRVVNRRRRRRPSINFFFFHTFFFPFLRYFLAPFFGWLDGGGKLKTESRHGMCISFQTSVQSAPNSPRSAGEKAKKKKWKSLSSTLKNTIVEEEKERNVSKWNTKMEKKLSVKCFEFLLAFPSSSFEGTQRVLVEGLSAGNGKSVQEIPRSVFLRIGGLTKTVVKNARKQPNYWLFLYALLWSFFFQTPAQYSSSIRISAVFWILNISHL